MTLEGWTVESSKRAVYRQDPYHPRVCGTPLPEVQWAYTVTVTVSSSGLTIAIDDEGAESVPGGAYLNDTIPLNLLAQLDLTA